MDCFLKLKLKLKSIGGYNCPPILKRGEFMGKHKHRRRHSDTSNVQQLPAPMPGFGGLGEMLGGGMGGGMNGMAGLLSSLGGLGGGGGNGMGSLLSGLMGGAPQGGGGDPLAALGGIGGIMNALQGLTGNQGQQGQPPQQQKQTQPASLKDILSNITEADKDALREVFSGILNSDSKKEEQRVESGVINRRKQEQSIEQILSSLDFNSILSSINNIDLSNFDFENIDLNNIDFDNMVIEDAENEGEENNFLVEEGEIVQENIFKSTSKLNESELHDLVNILVRLVEPSKLKALEKLLKN